MEWGMWVTMAHTTEALFCALTHARNSHAIIVGHHGINNDVLHDTTMNYTMDHEKVMDCTMANTIDPWTVPGSIPPYQVYFFSTGYTIEHTMVKP